MKRLALFCGLLLAAVAPTFAETAPQLDILQRADGARIVPEHFLRSWDPVTVFFESDAGPQSGGPEDAPERFVKMTPQVAGAWQWLGARALQFRPADPWKPLQAVEIEAAGGAPAHARLLPLLPAPVSTNPADGADPINELDHIVLTFADAIDLDALAKLLSIELRPAPGLSAAGGQFLNAQDFAILPLAPGKREAGRSYLVQLKNAVPDGRVAILRLKLSNAPGLDEPSFELRLQSAVPFTVTGANCGRGLERANLDGLLRCAPAADDSSADSSGSSAAKRSIAVAFSSKPETLEITQARDALRISPPVDRLSVEADGSHLNLSGRFLADTIYELSLAPGSIRDERKRPLEGPVFLQRFAFAAERPHLAFDARQGIVERFGPQLIPMRGAGFDKVDLRIHAIDALSRDFWPFPTDGVETDDATEPPLPGNAPGKWSEDKDADAAAIAARINALGSPAVSELAALPIQRGGAGAKFGLDLKPLFARIKGADQPGAYLVGMRPISGGKRSWMRVQVTDLTLTAVEEENRVRFFVTSLASAKPVEGAEIRLEGLRDDKFVTLIDGRTDRDGAFTWDVGKRAEAEIKRIVVAKGLDALVLEPANGPPEYARDNWTKPEEPWLAWTVNPGVVTRDAAANALPHLHREADLPARGTGADQRLCAQLSVRRAVLRQGERRARRHGSRRPGMAPSRDHRRDRQRLPEIRRGDPRDRRLFRQIRAGCAAQSQNRTTRTQDANAELADQGPISCGDFPFKKEAYRLPTFEVLLNAPQTVALEGEFSVDLVARYFAGGLVAGRPVKWRASQFPYAWTPPGREGWFFSTDARFSSDGKFKSTPVVERDGTLDDAGAAKISFDPSAEPTAQPRRYQIEATVVGEDDVEVRNLTSVIALPAFVLGVKTPRYQQKPGPIDAQILAVDAKGAPLAGLEMTARLIKRNWSSTLQASDFSQGAAKYVTEIVDETLVERKVTSAKDALKLDFEAKDAGVYLVELEAADKVGRRQKVSVDFFVGGDTPVTFARAPAQTAEVTTDKEAYAPGEIATLIVQSPFQNARALAVVENPNGHFGVDWVDIANGFGRYKVALTTPDMPKLPVHFLIMRGRLPGADADPGAPFDQGKPVTIAATKWINCDAGQEYRHRRARLSAKGAARAGDRSEPQAHR